MSSQVDTPSCSAFPLAYRPHLSRTRTFTRGYCGALQAEKIQNFSNFDENNRLCNLSCSSNSAQREKVVDQACSGSRYPVVHRTTRRHTVAFSAIEHPSISGLCVKEAIVKTNLFPAGNPDRICCHCDKDLRGMISKSHPPWLNDMMCENCHVKLPSCFSCERKAVPFAASSGRIPPLEIYPSVHLCGRCSCLSPVVSEQAVKTAVDDVLTFYKEELRIEFSQEMLEHQYLGQQTTKLSHGGEGGRRGSVVLPSIIRENENRRASLPGMLPTSESPAFDVQAEELSKMNRNMECATACAKFGKCESCKVRLGGVEKRFVGRIVVAKGLPTILFKTHLSHELFHAWLHLSNFPEMKPKVEEGLCNVIAVKFLQSQLRSASSESDREKLDQELIQYCLWKFHDNRTEVYGDGFREAQSAVETYGFFGTLDYVKEHAVLPVIDNVRSDS